MLNVKHSVSNCMQNDTCEEEPKDAELGDEEDAESNCMVVIP